MRAAGDDPGVDESRPTGPQTRARPVLPPERDHRHDREGEPRRWTQDQELWLRASQTDAKEDRHRGDEQQAGKAQAWLAGEPLWLRWLLGRGSGGSYPTGDDLERPGAGRLSPLPQIDRRLVVEFVGVVWEHFMDHLLGREPPVPFSIYVYCWY
jgi:hypothetical protein